MPECAQEAFLRRIFSVSRVAQQIPREGVNIIEIRERGRAKSLCSVVIVRYRPRHLHPRE
jgi:hypothetical protein